MEPPATKEDLKNLVREGVEETRRVEFKRELPPAGKNRDLARIIAAMANSEGGTLVYGVEEDDTGRADALHPIDLESAPERVNQVARSSIDEPVDLVDTATIEERDGKGYLVVTVPESERAPHFVNGSVWGRTTKGNARLSRREVGELFADSDGFAAEFGLSATKPGRVVVRTEREVRYSGRRPSRIYYLVFKNDGESDVEDVSYELEHREDRDSSRELPDPLNDPFPVPTLAAGQEIRFQIVTHLNTAAVFNVRVSWTSRVGTRKEKVSHIQVY